MNRTFVMSRSLLCIALALLAAVLLPAVSCGQESKQEDFVHPQTSLLLNISYSNTAFTENGSAGVSVGRFLNEYVELAVGARAFGFESSRYSYDPATGSPKETNTSVTFVSGSLALNLHMVSPALASKRLTPYVGLEGGYTLMKSSIPPSDSEETSWLWGGTAGMVLYFSRTWAMDGGWHFTFQKRPTDFGKTEVIDESTANLGIRTFF